MYSNEIKKNLYKENSKAKLLCIQNAVAKYEAKLFSGTTVQFSVPVTDMGTAKFMPEMDAKYLIRWIVSVDTIHGY